MVNKLVTINLRKYLVNQPRTKRIRKAVRYVREQVARHAKVSEENVKFSRELNERIFKYSAKHMTPLRLNISIENSIATASPFKEAQAKPQANAKEAKAAKPAPAKAAKEAKASVAAPDKAKANK
ncbi:MAG: hypothetical protein M1360_03025 [Candidatus Marsarchaeota archaeon]|jgi:ribosomal protein L31E|nr:hypothetical protein [Candidatus Marsarchaeota archaeon]MCL5418886.1 hypothetical protein [Candidatus Marsarchaeota archaeon]